MYRTTSVHGTSIHFGGGPYVAYCVSETDVVDGQATSSFSYHRTDAGLGVIFGATFINHILIDAGYEYGLVTVNSEQAAHNTAINIWAGYILK